MTLPAGRIPQLISESPKVASLAAMARSQEPSEVKAPPKHQPLTIAMVGLGKRCSCRHCHDIDARRTRITSIGVALSTSRKYSLISIPAEYESPAPVRTSTEHRLST